MYEHQSKRKAQKKPSLILMLNVERGFVPRLSCQVDILNTDTCYILKCSSESRDQNTLCVVLCHFLQTVSVTLHRNTFSVWNNMMNIGAFHEKKPTK